MIVVLLNVYLVILFILVKTKLVPWNLFWKVGGGFRGGGGGRRSDVELKHDISLLGRLDNGIGVYRFFYNGDQRAYVGVMAQEVEAIIPDAVVRGRDGYLRVLYGKVGLKFETYDRWLSSGARIPSAVAGNNAK